MPSASSRSSLHTGVVRGNPLGIRRGSVVCVQRRPDRSHYVSFNLVTFRLHTALNWTEMDDAKFWCSEHDLLHFSISIDARTLECNEI